MHLNDREKVIALTPLWKGERLPDGRTGNYNQWVIDSLQERDVVEGAAKAHVKDDFGFEMIGQGKFTTAQIDRNTWTEEMLDMLVNWIKTDPRGEAYRDLDRSKEYGLARNGDPNDTQTAL